MQLSICTYAAEAKKSIKHLEQASVVSTSRAYIPVGQAQARKSTISIAHIKVKDKKAETLGLSMKISNTVLADLRFMDIFRFIGPAAFIEPKEAGLVLGSFKLTDWTAIGVEYVIKSEISTEGNHAHYEAYLYETNTARTVLAKKYVSTVDEVKIMAHTFANDIVSSLTGFPGVFLSKIVMTCDRTSKKEIYMMNFDGSNVKQLTHHNSIAFAPAWRPDSKRIAYSIFTKRNGLRNIDLYEFDLENNQIRLLSNRKGINSGAAYSPDGTKLALTMSFLGNPEIFILDLTKGNSVTRLTTSLGFDVDPTWSPDGRYLAYVSSRTGRPMVFKLNVKDPRPERLTYAGRYNSTPSWSAKGEKIAFAGWIDNKFDIFIMSADGTKIERLTKNTGSNEDPDFSPDGSFVVFSSNRTGKSNIYIMNTDGSFVKRLTYGLGNCMTPRWSKGG